MEKNVWSQIKKLLSVTQKKSENIGILQFMGWNTDHVESSIYNPPAHLLVL